MSKSRKQCRHQHFEWTATVVPGTAKTPIIVDSQTRQAIATVDTIETAERICRLQSASLNDASSLVPIGHRKCPACDGIVEMNCGPIKHQTFCLFAPGNRELMKKLPMPRLQLRWWRVDDDFYHSKCAYELIMPSRLGDMRDVEDAGFVHTIFVTTGLHGEIRPNPLVSAAMHAGLDSEALNLPTYNIMPDGTPYLYDHKNNKVTKVIL